LGRTSPPVCARILPIWRESGCALPSPTARRACFEEDRAELVRFRVEAMRETAQLERCVREGAGFSDPQVRKHVKWCQRRLDKG
jgi:hypothetical protein